jgi:plasmid stabilization system protein ParE
MAQFAVEFHPLAADEAEAAERWYRERNETAAVRFRRELGFAVDRIAEGPEAGSRYLGNSRRILLLRRFPFFIVYRLRLARIEVIAVAHARRRPGLLARALARGSRP